MWTVELLIHQPGKEKWYRTSMSPASLFTGLAKARHSNVADHPDIAASDRKIRTQHQQYMQERLSRADNKDQNSVLSQTAETMFAPTMRKFCEACVTVQLWTAHVALQDVYESSRQVSRLINILETT